jgi:hypothetical protein
MKLARAGNLQYAEEFAEQSLIIAKVGSLMRSHRTSLSAGVILSK